MSGNSGWRYEVDGDVLTASNRVRVYKIRLGVLYYPSRSAEARAAHGRGPLGPRAVTQFLDGGTRLYASGPSNVSTVVKLSSFVSTYVVPFAPAVRAAHGQASQAPPEDDRLARIEALVGEVHKKLSWICGELGAK